MSSYSLDSLANFLTQAKRRYDDEPLERIPQRGDAHRFISESDTAQPPRSESTSWHTLGEVKAQGDTVNGIVTGWNRGGLLVRWEDLQGFVPASQLREVPVFDDDDSRDELLSRWVGEELCLKIIELDSSRNRLVFSERAALWGPRQGERLLAELSEGDVREGTVSNVCDFGAFVDLGGVDGLVHISELSWGRVTHPGTLLSIGDRVRVYVLSIDRTNHHVGLSIKRLQPNPWSLVEEKYDIGDVVEAKVTNVVDFGAFVQLEEGLEGLVHISELSHQRIQHPGQMVQVGDLVRVSILRIEKDEHRLSLSMKQARDGQLGSDHLDEPADDHDEISDGPYTFLY